MKLGMITGDLNQTRTGIGTYIYHLIEEFKKIHDITVIRHESGMDFPGCDSIIIQNKIKIRYNSLIWNQSLKWHFREFKDLDLIHNPGQFLVPPIRGVNSVVTTHDITPVLYPQYHFPFRTWSSRIFLPSVLKKSVSIIADSYQTKQDVCSYYHITQDIVHVVHLAADTRYKPLPTREIEEWRQSNGLNFPYILFVGTIEPRKNIHTLLQAFFRIAGAHLDLHLVLVGNVGWNADTVLTEMKSSIFADRIHYLNYLPYKELPYLYNGALALVYPSWYEGFGLPPLEAMQCGVPVVCSNRASLPEVIGSGGILLDPHDVNGFADVISRLITDDIFHREQMHYGLERSKQFSWKKTARETAMVYDKVMQRD